MTMKMKSLNISRGYGSEARLTGHITYTTSHGEVRLSLTDEDCRPILEHCAEAVATASRRVAENLTSEAVSTTAIEHKPEAAE